MHLQSFRLCFLLTLLLSTISLYAGDKADIVVSPDGTGDFTSVNEAVQSVPADNNTRVTILVKNGIYEEKVIFTSSNIVLVGESRDSTIIRFAELRKNWMESHESHFGSAVINIDSSANDITIANMTIHNNYGALYGDNGHQYAIFGTGTRIILLNCNVIADGADTVSLWNESEGMYYHSDCYFEGHVDYVCPRGWCYITDSEFYGHNLTASLWHKGIDDKSAKFVIRYSYFDGVPGFPLGRHHYDAQFYLLDCIFSENLADVPIFWPVSPNAKIWKWGSRHYFYNCHRIGGDYDWFADNLSDAANSPEQEIINASWTFDGKWNPEEEISSVLPFVFKPFPRSAAYLDFPEDELILSWKPSRNAESFNVYFWKSEFPQALERGEKLKDGPAASGEPVFIGNQKEASYKPDKLDPNSTYYWRIDEVIDGGPVEGSLWHFTLRK